MTTAALQHPHIYSLATVLYEMPRARKALEVLLDDIERSESRLPPGERIDLGWLRPELGLPGPPRGSPLLG